MFTPFSRLLLLLLLAVASILAAVFGIWTLLILSAALSFLLLWGYFRYATVKLALSRIYKEDYEEAERIIDYTTKPQSLNRSQKAYYFFVKGFIAREKEQYQDAFMMLEEALAMGIKGESDRARAILALADMALVQKHKSDAKTYFSKIKDLKVDPKLMPAIRKMQQWLAD